MLLINEHTLVITSLAIIINILIAGGIFLSAPLINRVLGKNGFEDNIQNNQPASSGNRRNDYPQGYCYIIVQGIKF